VAVRNAEGLIVDKVRNSLALDHPGLELVFVSDGSSDRTAELIRQHSGGRIRLLELEQHLGKAQALNRGAELCSGEVLVFSDADALLARDALRALLRHYADPRVGGVCGQRVIGEDPGELDHAQDRYIALDSALKLAESRVGSITSNDGKLYSIRRSLFRPIAGGATDDLYSCLNVVEQGRRFVFEPRALAFIRKPSRSPAHELARRRRIVARSLNGILLMRGLLNPLHYGAFSIGLLVNKVFRRLLPVFLALLLVSSAALAWERPWARVVLAAQLLFYGLALFHPLLRRASGLRVLAPAGGLAFYFCLGNLGTLLGLGDFLRRRETIKWDPLKAD
jgi:cellulose synthase/poly-beta-1,6-N-acetylglucosamine synthase-like glycosyltransferase